MQRAFWDILREELAQEPPVYKQSLTLLAEVKKALLGLLVPQQKRAIESIEAKLDMELIAQQTENGALDFNQYSEYVVNLMGQLCAPVRDEAIDKLRRETEVVPLFKGILETLDLMKLDMANFHIQQARPFIVSQSVEYEKVKFKEFLDKQPNGEGLKFTREWMKRHSPSAEEIRTAENDSKLKKLLAARILGESYLEILEWDEFHPFPETLVMDAKRIVALRDACERASLSTAVILLTFSNIGALVTPIDAQKLKETVKKHVDVLLEDFFDDTDLLKILPGVALQVNESMHFNITVLPA